MPGHYAHPNSPEYKLVAANERKRREAAKAFRESPPSPDQLRQFIINLAEDAETHLADRLHAEEPTKAKRSATSVNWAEIYEPLRPFAPRRGLRHETIMDEATKEWPGISDLLVQDILDGLIEDGVVLKSREKLVKLPRGKGRVAVYRVSKRPALAGDRESLLSGKPSGTKPDADAALRKLDESTPAFDASNGDWVRNKLAASLEGVGTRTLADYRQDGITNAEGSIGRDRDGRVWRQVGTKSSHPWYLKSTLKSQHSNSTTAKNRR